MFISITDSLEVVYMCVFMYGFDSMYWSMQSFKW